MPVGRPFAVVGGAVDDEGLVAMLFDDGPQEGQVHRRPAGVAAGEITENSVRFRPGRIYKTDPHDLLVPLYFLFVEIFDIVEGLGGNLGWARAAIKEN